MDTATAAEVRALQQELATQQQQHKEELRKLEAKISALEEIHTQGYQLNAEYIFFCVVVRMLSVTRDT